jgi:hypothetical protein
MRVAALVELAAQATNMRFVRSPSERTAAESITGGLPPASRRSPRAGRSSRRIGGTTVGPSRRRLRRP